MLQTHCDGDHIKQKQDNTPKNADHHTVLPADDREDARRDEQDENLNGLPARGNKPAPQEVVPDRFSLFRFIVQNMEPIHHATGEEEDYGGHRRGCQNLQQEHHHVSVLIHLVH